MICPNWSLHDSQWGEQFNTFTELNSFLNLKQKKFHIFLKKIGKEELCNRSLAELKTRRIPFIDHIDGSYFNVMGLPIVELLNALENF